MTLALSMNQWIAVTVCIACASCGSSSGGVCAEAAAVSYSCGGRDVSSADQSACATRVSSACSVTEQRAYADYLGCAADRCANDSPTRQIAVHCDALLAAVSPGCFTAGVSGNSDYRYCLNGADTCRSGFVCDTTRGMCVPQ